MKVGRYRRHRLKRTKSTNHLSPKDFKHRRRGLLPRRPCSSLEGTGQHPSPPASLSPATPTLTTHHHRHNNSPLRIAEDCSPRKPVRTTKPTGPRPATESSPLAMQGSRLPTQGPPVTDSPTPSPSSRRLARFRSLRRLPGTNSWKLGKQIFSNKFR